MSQAIVAIPRAPRVEGFPAAVAPRGRAPVTGAARRQPTSGGWWLRLRQARASSAAVPPSGLAPRTARPVTYGGLGLKSEFYCIRNPVCFRLRMMYGLRSGPETGRRVRGEGNWRSQVEGCASEAQVSALAAMFITGVGKKQIRKMKFQNIKKKLERSQRTIRDEMARNPV